MRLALLRWRRLKPVPKGGVRLSEKDDANTRVESIAPDPISGTMV